MSRKLVLVVSLFVLVSSLAHARFNQVEVKTANGYPVHNLDTGFNYTTIQEAIKANKTSNGHTIFVEAGTYCENVVVDKCLTLIGEASSTTIIDGLSTGNVMSITVGNVTVTGFTIQNSSYFSGCCGIHVSSSGNNISHNIITNNNQNGIVLSGAMNNTIYRNNITTNDNNGIKLEGSSYNNVSGNNVRRNDYYGIALDYSSCNNVSGNNLTINCYGIALGHSSSNNSVYVNNIANNDYYGISLGCYSSNNSMYENDITNNWYGIYFRASSTAVHNSVFRNNIANNGYGILLRSNHNDVYGNNITGNTEYGILLDGSSNNTFYHNNFIGNTHQLSISPSEYANLWDDGYPSGGNYWSDHPNKDLCNGPNQNETGSDGVGEIPYTKNANNTDRYPLMGPIRAFTAGTWEEKTRYVDVISNSTVSNFKVDETGKTISLNVTGTEVTAGFCRITIPNIIVQDFWQGSYIVLLNGEPWFFRNWTDNTDTYIYVNYTHSEHEIIIIPEFPSLIMMPLVMTATLLAVIVQRRKHFM